MNKWTNNYCNLWLCVKRYFHISISINNITCRKDIFTKYFDQWINLPGTYTFLHPPSHCCWQTKRTWGWMMMMRTMKMIMMMMTTMMMIKRRENEYLGVVGRKMLRTARFSSGSLQWVGSSLSFIALKLEKSIYQVC